MLLNVVFDLQLKKTCACTHIKWNLFWLKLILEPMSQVNYQYMAYAYILSLCIVKNPWASTWKCWNILTNVFARLSCRMERSESSSSSVSVVVPDRDMVRPSGQLSEPARPSKNRERPSKSPRRRRKGTRLQQRGGDHEQLLWEIERRRLPGQHEHLEPSGSASDPVESSPKRFALQAASWSIIPLLPLRCPGCEVMVSWLVRLFFFFLFSLLTGEPTFYMDRIQPLTSDPRRAFFPTRRQSCKRDGADWVVLLCRNF